MSTQSAPQMTLDQAAEREEVLRNQARIFRAQAEDTAEAGDMVRSRKFADQARALEDDAAAVAEEFGA